MPRHIFLLLAMRLFLLTSSAQIYDQLVFNDTIDFGHGTTGFKSLEWNDGILVLGSRHDGAADIYGFTITFYDQTGTIIWSEIYNHTLTSRLLAKELIAFNDNSFYIGGSWLDSSINYYEMFIAKFNNEGDSLFFRFYSDSVNNTLKDITCFNDNILALRERHFESDSVYSHIVIQKIDTVGNLIESHEDPLAMRDPAQIVYDDSGKIFVGGIMRDSPTDFYHILACLSIYNDDFSPAAPLSFTTPDGGINSFFGDMQILNNYLYVTTLSLISGPGSNPYQTRISKIQLQPVAGVYLANALIGPEAFSLGISPTGILNDSILIMNINDGVQKFYAVDTGLNQICEFRFPVFAEDDYIYNLNGVFDNQLFASGFSVFDNLYNREWNVLTENMDLYFKSGCMLTEIGQTENPPLNIKCFPNPFQNTLYLTANEDFTNGNYYLYDISGQLMASGDFHADLTLQLPALANGIYFMKITNNDEWVSFKLVKEN